jgi:hypothetical protein
MLMGGCAGTEDGEACEEGDDEVSVSESEAFFLLASSREDSLCGLFLGLIEF